MLVGCIAVVFVYYFSSATTYLNLTIAFMSIYLISLIAPGDPDLILLGFISVRIVLILTFSISLFVFPAMAINRVCNKFISNWVLSVLIGGWMVCYIVLFALVPSIETP